MSSANISIQKISQVLSESISQGSYSVPHIIDELPIGTADRKCLTSLIKIQNMIITKTKEYSAWFPVCKKNWLKYSGSTKKTFALSRQRLKYMGLIDYRSVGGCNRRIECRVLIDPFYLYDHLLDSEKGVKAPAYTSTAQT